MNPPILDPNNASICYHCGMSILDPDYCPQCKAPQKYLCEGCEFEYHRAEMECPKCGVPRKRSSRKRHHRRRSLAERVQHAWTHPKMPRLNLPRHLPVRFLTLGQYERCWRCKEWAPNAQFMHEGEDGVRRRSRTCNNCFIKAMPRMEDLKLQPPDRQP